MSEIKIVSKASHKVLQELNSHQAVLSEASVVVLKVNMDDVQQITKEGKNAVITLKSGEKIVIVNFFTGEGYDTENSLVLDDDKNKLLWAQFTDANGAMLDNITLNYIDSIEPLLYQDSASGLWGWLAVPLAAAGIILWAGNHNNDGDGRSSRVLDKPVINPVNGKDPITGEAEPGSKVEVTFPDGSKNTVTVNPDGTWSVPNPGLKDGDTIIAKTIDETGNVSPPTTAIVDAVAPDAPIIDPVNGKDPITGKAEPGSKVEVTFPDGSKNTVTVNPDGTWSVPNPGLNDGDTIIAKAIDEAGNVSPPTTAIVDAVAPDAPIIDPVNGKDLITGEAEPGSKVEVTFPDGGKNTVTVNPDGTWSVPNPGLNDGDTIIAKAIDEAGNVSPPTTAIVDAVAPDKPIIDPLDLTDPVTGSAEPGSKIVVTFPDGSTETTVTDADGKWIVPNPGLKDGDEVTATATDKANNTSPPATAIVDISIPTASASIESYTDDVAPQVGDYQSGSSTNDQTPTLNIVSQGTLAVGDVIVVYRNGTKVGTATLSADGRYHFTDSGLVDGQRYEYHTAVENSSGKVGISSPIFVINLDTTAPGALTIDSVTDNVEFIVGPIQPDGVTNDTTPTVKGSGAEPNAVITLKDSDGTVLGTTTADSNGQWSIEPAPGHELSDGPHTLHVTQTDLAGNEGPAVDFSLTVDSHAPQQATQITDITDDVDPLQGSISNGGFSNDTSPTLHGNISAGLAAGEKVVILRDGVVIGTASVNGTDWTFQDSALVDGKQYEYTARVEDAAGNQGGISQAYVINIDSTVPSQIVSIESVTDDFGPVQGSYPSGATIDDSTPTLNGTLSAALSANEVLVMYRDGIKVGTVNVAAGVTQWSYLDAGLNAGIHHYTARVEDAAGNQGQLSNDFSLTYVNTGSSNTGTILSIEDNVDPVQGNVANGGYSNDTSPLIKGDLANALVSGEKVAVYRNNVKVGEAVVNGTTWSFQDSGLVDGQQYSYSVAVENAAGLAGAESAPYVIHIDTTAPSQSVVITEIVDNKEPMTGVVSNGGFTNDDTPEIKGTLSAALAAGEVLSIYRNGIKVGTAQVTGNTWSFTDAGLSSVQQYTYTAQVEDLAGNVSQPSNAYSIQTNFDGASQTVNIIRILDDVDPIQGVIVNNGFTNDKTPTLEGSLGASLSAGDVIVIYRNNVEVGIATVNGTSWTFSDNLTTDGNYVYSAVVRNGASLDGAPSNSYQINLDTTAPSSSTVIDITSISDDTGLSNSDFITNDTSLTINGTLTGTLAAGEVAQISIDGGLTWTTLQVTAGSWNYVDSRTLTDGDYTYQVRVVDTAGNVGSTDLQVVTVDTTAPSSSTVIDITSITDDTGLSNSDFITSDTSLTINGTLTGTLAAGEVAQISIDGGLTWTTLQVTAGSWNYVDSRTLTDGDYTYQVRVVDTAGNVGSTDLQVVTVDTTAPSSSTVIDITSITDDTGLSNSDFITSDTSLTINGTLTGTLAAGEVAQISIDGGLTWTTLQVTAGSWNYVDSRTLTDGDYTYQVRVVDTAGNVGSTDLQVVTVDTTAPSSSTVIDITSITDDTGLSNSDFITNDTSLTINGTLTGTLAAGEVAQISIDGGLTWTTLQVTAGSWNYVDSRTLTDGDYTYQVRVVDTAGNVGSTDLQVVTVDTTAPSSSTVIDITSITDDTGLSNSDFITNDTSLTINGTLTGTLAAGEVAQISIDGGLTWTTLQVTAGSWNYVDSRTLTDGDYTYQVRVVDTAGNVGSTDLQVVTVDTTAPSSSTVIDITSITDDTGLSNSDFITSDTSLTINGTLTGTLAAGEVAQISIDGGLTWTTLQVTAGSWNYVDSRTLTDGDYTYQVRVVDTAGNVGSTDLQVVTVDTTAPSSSTVIDITSITDDTGLSNSDFITSDTSLTINGTLTGTLAAGEVAQISIDGGLTWTTLQVTASSWNYVDSRTLTDGDYTYQVRVVDTAGNVGSTDLQVVTVDTTAPSSSTVIDITSITDDTGLSNSDFITSDTSLTINGTLTGTLAAGEVAQISIDGGLTWTTLQVTAGSWNYVDSRTLTDGDYTYQVRVVDTAGNVGSTDLQVVTVDTTAPSSSTVIDITSITDDTGLSNSDFITSDTSLTINGTLTGTLAAGEVAQISIDGGLTWTTLQVTAGSWNYVDSRTLTDGDYTYQVRVVDTAGNVGSTDLQVVTVDTTAPSSSTVIDITSITDDTGLSNSDFITSDTSLTINGTLTGTLAAGEVAQISIDGGLTWTTLQVTAGSWNYVDSRTLTDGDYTYQVRVVDTAGNVGSTDLQVVTVDTTAPSSSTVIDITSITDDTGLSNSDFITSDTSLTINGTLTGTLAAGEVAQISIDGGLTWTTLQVTASSWNYVDSRTLTDGDYTYQVRVVDTAGNVGSTDLQVVTVDTTAPSSSTVIDITSITDDTGLSNSDFITSDTSLTINGTLTGTLAAGEVAQISIDGGLTWTTLQVTAGSWNYVDSRTLTDGDYTYQVRVVDTAGNVGSTDLQVVTVDTTAPSSSTVIDITSITDDTGLSNSDFITSDTSLTINGTLTGTLAAGEVAQISIDGGLTWTTLQVTAGSWNYVDSRTLTDGDYTYQVRVVDTAGNVGSTDLQVVTVDTTAPSSSTVIDITSITDDTGLSNSDFITSDTSLTINGTLTGTLAAGEVAQISIDGGLTWTTLQVTAGSWNYVDSRTLTDGDYTYQVRVVDTAGNVGSTDLQVVTVDTTAPSSSTVIDITSITDDTGLSNSDFITSDTSLTINGTLTGTLAAGEVAQISIDGGLTWTTLQVTAGSWNYVDSRTLTDGDYTYQVRVVDTAGNVGSTDLQVVTVDTTAPSSSTVIDITSITDDTGLSNSDFITSDTSLTINGTLTGTLAAGEVAQISIDGGLTWTTLQVTASSWNYVDSRTLTDGDYTYQVRVVDTAGNVGSTDLQVVTVDTTAPSSSTVIDITSITDDTGLSNSDFITSDTSLTINGTLTGTLAAGEVAQISIDGGLIWTTLQVTAGSWNYVDSRTLTDGDYTYQVRVVDTAGNVGSTDLQVVTVDTTAPTQIPFIISYTDKVGMTQGDFGTNTTTDDRNPILNGGINTPLVVGERLGIYDSITNNFLGYANIVNSTNWTFQLNNLADLTSYSFYAAIVDTAGNIGTPSAGFTININASGPNVTGLTTTFAVSVDTDHGVPNSGLTTTITQSNSDLITRDGTPNMSGTLSRSLGTGEILEISKDGGVSWAAVTMTGLNWDYAPGDIYTTDTVLNIKLRVKDSSGNTTSLTGQDRTVTLELSTPGMIQQAPIVSNTTDSVTTYTFSNTVYGALPAGTTVALINDVNNNGMWQEGIDKVIAKAIVNADGSWSISTTLPTGALNLGFMVWDAAGNISKLSPITHTGVNLTTGGGGFEVIATNWGGTAANIYGTNAAASGLSIDGNWSFAQAVRAQPSGANANAARVYEIVGNTYNVQYLAEPTIANGAGENVTDHGYGGTLTSMTFVDINRDGRADLISQISGYGLGNTAYWLSNLDGTYSPKALDFGTTVHIGAVIVYDRTGDGYLDMVYGDSSSDSASFFKNNAGTLVLESGNGGTGAYSSLPPSAAMTVMNGLGTSGVTGQKIPNTFSFFHEISGVDIDNNGTIDLIGNVNYNGATAVGDSSKGMAVLYNSGTSSGFTYVNYANVFEGNAAVNDDPKLMSMTYADFNGDGWLDLYMDRGAKGGVASSESRIYLNDGTGKLNATDAAALWFGDSKPGASSFAIDWNLDGKMDIVEVPGNVGGSFVTSGFSPTLYLNNGTNVWGNNPISLGPSYSNITGAAAVDYDWDGAIDLILYRPGADAQVGSTTNAATSILIRNTNVVADGTSMHVRIVDGQGINAYYGNTVKLYDSAGNLVSTQIINPQSSGSSNSTGLVSFYGLKANESYSVQLLKITNGVSDNVAGVANLGGYTNNTINSSWSGLKAGKGNENYVLTAESDTAVTNSVSNGIGITGTGYNDHFFGSAGNDHFNGGGGWQVNFAGVSSWVANGGQDILDYSRLQNASININATAGIVTKVINGVTYTDTFENIENFIINNGTLNFNGSSNNETVTGGSGNDTYNLGGAGGGSDIIYFRLLNSTDATGGNGSDLAKNFGLGPVGTNADADVIDIHELLTGYNGTAGLYLDTDGLKLDIASRQLNEYLKVSYDGANTIIAIDRDGGGDSFATLLTLENVKTDLVTMLLNNQIII